MIIRFFKSSILRVTAVLALVCAVVTDSAHAVGSATETAFETAVGTISTDLTTLLPVALGIMAILVGVGLLYKLFKRVAK